MVPVEVSHNADVRSENVEEVVSDAVGGFRFLEEFSHRFF